MTVGCFAAAGKMFCTGSYDNTVTVWEVGSKQHKIKLAVSRLSHRETGITTCLKQQLIIYIIIIILLLKQQIIGMFILGDGI